jgi:hypothetical protein
VERAIGRLPSIAVFLDRDDKIDSLLAATQPLLGERNIPIVGYKGGLVVGDARGAHWRASGRYGTQIKEQKAAADQRAALCKPAFPFVDDVER